MKSYASADEYSKENKPSAVALGCFDGVHLGHAEIIRRAVMAGKEKKLFSLVWSFNTPPRSFLATKGSNSVKNAEAPSLLTPYGEKKRLIKALYADGFIGVDFNESIASMTPREFFDEILIKKLCARHILCGFNYKFGKGGKGDVALLRELCKQADIELTVIDEITLDGKTVSSSAIRSMLASGEIAGANKMLGRYYSIRSRVADGQHLGRELGFPTVNQSSKSLKSLKKGVYLTRVSVLDKTNYGVTNVGVRPTVRGSSLVCETHIFDFNESIYGKYVKIEFLEFIREERKFDSLEALKAQILQDSLRARELSETNGYTQI